ncbi:MAG: metallopeptidase family protein [Pseudomonadota bacterium]
MNFNRPPNADDLLQLSLMHLATLPPHLAVRCADLSIQIEEFPDDSVEADLGLEDSYELLCLYKSARDVAPGVQRKNAHGDDVLMLYRRPILDMWAETGDDLNTLLNHIMVNEISAQFDMDAGMQGDAVVEKKV